jgi:sulfoxide reductase heme-binding subunit YedZ
VTLHKLVYAAAVLGVIHFFFVTKADDRWPTFALGVWAVMMALRAAWWLKGRRARGARAEEPRPTDEPLPTRS